MCIYVLCQGFRPHQWLDKVGEEEISKGGIYASPSLEFDVYTSWWSVLRSKPESEAVELKQDDRST